METQMNQAEAWPLSVPPPVVEDDTFEPPLALAFNSQGVTTTFSDPYKVIREFAVTPIYRSRIGDTKVYRIGTQKDDMRIEASSDALRQDFGLGESVRTVISWGNFDNLLLNYHLDLFRRLGYVGHSFKHVLEKVRMVDFQASYQVQTGSYEYLSFEELLRKEGVQTDVEYLNSEIRSRGLAQVVMSFIDVE